MIGCAWIGWETRGANVGGNCGEWWFGHFFCAACMWLRSKYKPGPTVREAEAEAPEKRKQLQTRHVYGFDDSDIFLYSFFQQKARVFLGPVDPQTLGRKELLLDFYFIQFLKISYPVPFCEFLGLLCEHVRICPWRLVKMDYDTVTCVGEVSTNSTWRLISRHTLLKMLQKLERQPRRKLLQMRCVLAFLGCCRKTSVRPVIMHENARQLLLETCWNWNHESTGCAWLRSLREAEADSLQTPHAEAAARVIKSPRKSLCSFICHGAWLRSCIVMNLKQDAALSGMEFSK